MPWYPRAATRPVLLVLLGLAIAAGPLRAQQTPATVTLDQAVELALRHSPQLAQARGTVDNAAVGERSAWGQFLPSLSASTGASLSSSQRYDADLGTTVPGGSNDSYNAGLSASVPLFTGGRRGATISQARAESDAAEAGLVEQRYAVTLSAKSAFFNVLRADELIRVAELRVGLAEEGLSAAETRAQLGSGTRSDILRAQLELTNARQSLLQAENQKRTAMYALGRLIGADGAVDVLHEQALEPTPLALTRDELLDLVVSRSPGVVSAQASARSAEAGIQTARAQYFPSVSTSGGFSWFNDDPRLAGTRRSWSARLSVSLPIFNGFQREESLARANVQADIARVQLDDARRAAVAELESVLGALRLAEQQVELTEEAVAVAEEDLRVQEQRYEMRVATILDRVTSQVNLVQAEVDRIAARYDYQVARAELEALIGREL